MKRFFILSGLFVGILLSGCAHYSVQRRGTRITQEALAKLVPGITTVKEVEEIFGKPDHATILSSSDILWEYWYAPSDDVDTVFDPKPTREWRRTRLQFTFDGKFKESSRQTTYERLDDTDKQGGKHLW
jgi:hypothetical protein